MVSATRSKLGLGLVAAVLLSTVPAPQAQAFCPVAAFKALTPCQKATLVAAVILTPYFMNFLTRKPLKAPRFDQEKLLHGTIAEKIQHAHYFFADNIIGWPRKDNKSKVVEDENEPGKYRLDFTIGQEPAGLVGHTLDKIDTAAKALALPAKTLGTIALIGGSFMWLMGLKEKASKVTTISLSNDTVMALAGALKG
jgi:hypothetical protein